MNRINEVTRHCLDALIELRQCPPTRLPPPDQVREGMVALVDDLLQRASDQGFAQSDCQEIAYPVVALADEIAVGKSDAFRDTWLPRLLQMQYFGENTAGDSFFRRLDVVRADPQRREILRAYHLCLLLGFQGHYRVRGKEIELLKLTDELGRTVEAPEALSPHLARASTADKRLQLGPLLMAAGAVLACALLFYAGLRLALSSHAASVASAFTAASSR